MSTSTGEVMVGVQETVWQLHCDVVEPDQNETFNITKVESPSLNLHDATVGDHVRHSMMHVDWKLRHRCLSRHCGTRYDASVARLGLHAGNKYARSARLTLCMREE
jgi:hypothetical protein